MIEDVFPEFKKITDELNEAKAKHLIERIGSNKTVK